MICRSIGIRFIVVLALVALAIGWFLPDRNPVGNLVVGDAPAIKTVLFLGNSFVNANKGVEHHLSKLTQSVFAGASSVFFFKSMTKGGARLSDHVRRAEDMITNFSHKKKNGPWDLVVLQGQSSEPLYGSRAVDFEDAARQLDGMIRAAGSRTAFFMTWAYKSRPQMTGPLSDAYTGVGRELDALVVPVGLAFASARSSNPTMELYAGDGKHPSLLGTYLAASVFFATLYGKSPVGASYTAGLSARQVKFAQTIAWKTVRDYSEE